MQSIIDALQSALGGNLGLLLGCVLIGALLIQALLMIVSTSRRMVFEARQRRLEQDRLQLQIKAAALKCQEAEEPRLFWNGYRKFQVARKVRECADVFSFYLVPHDGKPLPPFRPGQYLTFQLHLPDQPKPVVRCYSLSDSPNHPDYYRVTIKKAPPPPDSPGAPAGLVSNYFCDTVKEGDILDVKAPSGHFVLDTAKETPVVLVSGGVGITPMLSMLNTLVEKESNREVWFFFGARNRSEHLQKEHLERLAARHDNVRLNICYSRPEPDDRSGRDFHHAERVSVDLFKRLLPSNNYDFLVCGPPAFMKSITDGLKDWGVPDDHVFFEAFGPATVKKAAPPLPSDTSQLAKLKITFGRSAKTCRWNPTAASLLDFAEDHGIRIDAGCRAGNCGTCLVAIKSGEVEYLAGHGAEAEAGSCLTCICKPKSDLVLDA